MEAFNEKMSVLTASVAEDPSSEGSKHQVNLPDTTTTVSKDDYVDVEHSKEETAPGLEEVSFNKETDSSSNTECESERTLERK